MEQWGGVWGTVAAIAIVLGLSIWPALRWYHAWIRERVLGTAVAVCLCGGHVLVLFFLYELHDSVLFLVYLGALNALLLLEPSLSRRVPAHQLDGIHDHDIARYRQLITEHPEQGRFYTALADALMARREYDEAIANYELAVAYTPGACRTEQHKLKRARAARAAVRARAARLPRRAPRPGV